MKVRIHLSKNRGMANHGWLDSKHSFSFDSFYDPDRMGVGKLRVLNDDTLSPGKGFEAHPHHDMEIISIPLTGELRHKDSKGNTSVIRPNEVQVMSAGTGIYHSEFNNSDKRDVNFLQLWIVPDKVGIQPSYEQMKFIKEERKNRFQLIVSPMDEDYDCLKINQNAYITLTEIDKSITYRPRDKGNALFLFITSGSISALGETLNDRDAVEVEGIETIEITPKRSASLLIVETSPL